MTPGPGFHAAIVGLFTAIGFPWLATVAAQAEPTRPAPEPFVRSTAALFWPGATRSFLVTPPATLDNGEWVTSFICSSDGIPSDSFPDITYSPPSLPIASWLLRSGDVTWEFEAVEVPGPVA